MGCDQWNVSIAWRNALDGQSENAENVVTDVEQIRIAHGERHQRQFRTLDDKSKPVGPDGVESVAANGRRLDLGDVVFVIDADADEGTHSGTFEQSERAWKVLGAEHLELDPHGRHPRYG